MARFITIANSITAINSYGPVGMRDTNPQDFRGQLQIDSLLGNQFEARVYATNAYNYSTNAASGEWHDVTDRFRLEADVDADFVLVGGKFQKRNLATLGLPLDSPGIYALDDGFSPGAIFVGVITAPSSGHLDLYFGF